MLRSAVNSGAAGSVLKFMVTGRKACDATWKAEVRGRDQAGTVSTCSLGPGAGDSRSSRPVYLVSPGAHQGVKLVRSLRLFLFLVSH